jgi:hypothetical protein
MKRYLSSGLSIVLAIFLFSSFAYYVVIRNLSDAEMQPEWYLTLYRGVLSAGLFVAPLGALVACVLVSVVRRQLGAAWLFSLAILPAGLACGVITLIAGL